MWARWPWVLFRLAGTFLFAATLLPPDWVWLGRPLLLASVAFVVLAIFWSRRRA
jgi:hypothetical protein